MEIRNLNTFLKVAALRNFTAAGRELGYSQANISAQIKQLEQEVGAPLFNRVGRTVTLTQYAEELLPYARSIVSTAVQMENRLRSGEALGGTVHVGMVESLFDALAESALPEYHRRFPNVRLEITVDATESLKEQLRRGTLDLAVVIDAPLPPQEWQILASGETRAVVVANRRHPLAGRETLSLRDLEGQEFILMEHTAPYAVQFQAALAEQTVAIKPVLTLQSSAMARRLVQQGQWLSVLPLYTVADTDVAVLPIPELELRQTIQTILHRNKVLLPQLTGFSEIIGGNMT